MEHRLSGAGERAGFVVELEGFSGPLELLLELARAQKVDLAAISILALADQYLAYLRRARELQLGLAAEYLVIAAWLLYLKSQLLLPPEKREAPDADQMARDLAERLRLLDAVRRGAKWLAERPRLGVARFPRGMPEERPLRRDGGAAATLAQLLRARARLGGRRGGEVVRMPRPRLMTVEAALERLSRLLAGREWRELSALLPPDYMELLPRRSALASSFVASLELARRGEVELHQERPFAPLLIRRR